MHLFFGFSGRIGRSQWWIAQLANLCITAVILVAIWVTAVQNISREADHQLFHGLIWGSVAFAAAVIPALWIYLASTVKRLHDRGRTGWFALLPVAIKLAPYLVLLGAYKIPGLVILLFGFYVIELVILLWLLVECGFLSGTKGPNHWGEPGGTSGPSGPQDGIDFGDLDAKIARLKTDQSGQVQASPHMISGRSPAAQSRGFQLDPARRGGFGQRVK